MELDARLEHALGVSAMMNVTIFQCGNGKVVVLQLTHSPRCWNAEVPGEGTTP
jgi:hypothetical protein